MHRVLWRDYVTFKKMVQRLTAVYKITDVNHSIWVLVVYCDVIVTNLQNYYFFSPSNSVQYPAMGLTKSELFVTSVKYYLCQQQIKDIGLLLLLLCSEQNTLTKNIPKLKINSYQFMSFKPRPVWWTLVLFCLNIILIYQLLNLFQILFKAYLNTSVMAKLTTYFIFNTIATTIFLSKLFRFRFF